MREILFRGKEIDNGEWVCGALFQIPSKNFCAIFEQTLEALNYTVIPETVGQYTGLTDKNGVKIFEGDVIKDCWHSKNLIGIIRYGEYQNPCDDKFSKHIGFYIEWNKDADLTRKDLGYWLSLVEVIGNIHDNQELIGG